MVVFVLLYRGCLNVVLKACVTLLTLSIPNALVDIRLHFTSSYHLLLIRMNITLKYTHDYYTKTSRNANLD